MNRADIYNGGANCRSAFADLATATAGGSGDATESNGVYVSRDDGNGNIAMSAKLVIAYEAVLADTKSLTLAVNIQDDSDGAGSTVADFGTALAATTVATSSGGSTERGTLELDFDLSDADMYLRSQITPNLTASGTDTANISATWIFFGYQRGPVSQSAI